MKSIFFTLFTVIAVAMFLTAAAFAETQPNSLETEILTDATDALPLDRLYASPSLSGPSARMVKYSPDGTRVTFLKSRADEQNRFDLWQYNVATGAQSLLVDSRLLEPEPVELSEEEKALRERKRISGTVGITRKRNTRTPV